MGQRTRPGCGGQEAGEQILCSLPAAFLYLYPDTLYSAPGLLPCVCIPVRYRKVKVPPSSARPHKPAEPYFQTSVSGKTGLSDRVPDCSRTCQRRTALRPPVLQRGLTFPQIGTAAAVAVPVGTVPAGIVVTEQAEVVPAGTAGAVPAEAVPACTAAVATTVAAPAGTVPADIVVAEQAEVVPAGTAVAVPAEAVPAGTAAVATTVAAPVEARPAGTVAVVSVE